MEVEAIQVNGTHEQEKPYEYNESDFFDGLPYNGDYDPKFSFGGSEEILDDYCVADHLLEKAIEKTGFRPITFSELRRYNDQVKKSGGFDVDPLEADTELFGFIMALPETELNKRYEYFMTLACEATATYNHRKRKNFKCVRVLKVNSEAHSLQNHLYYITFEATDDVSTKTFQTRVLLTGVKTRKIEIVRQKPWFIRPSQVLEANSADILGSRRAQTDKGKGKAVVAPKKTSSAVATAAPAPSKPGGIVIREPSAVSRPSSQSSKGKESIVTAKDGEPPKKRQRPTVELPQIPAVPEADGFNALEFLSKSLSEAASVKRDDLARASTENTQDPSEEIARFLLAAGLRVLANSVSRKDLLSERDDAREDARRTRQENIELRDELNVTKVSQDTLQGGYDRMGHQLQEATNLNNQLNAKVASLEDDLRKEKENFQALSSLALRQVKWRGSRYNYIGFKNAIAQLRLRNPNLDTTGICPNKVVEGRLIRDPFRSDAMVRMPRMPENFDLDGYESQGDEDFPWFPNEVVPLPGESVPAETAPPADAGASASGAVAQEMDVSAPSGGDAEGAPSATTTEDPPSAA